MRNHHELVQKKWIIQAMNGDLKIIGKAYQWNYTTNNNLKYQKFQFFFVCFAFYQWDIVFKIKSFGNFEDKHTLLFWNAKSERHQIARVTYWEFPLSFQCGSTSWQQGILEFFPAKNQTQLYFMWFYSEMKIAWVAFWGGPLSFQGGLTSWP